MRTPALGRELSASSFSRAERGGSAHFCADAVVAAARNKIRALAFI